MLISQRVPSKVLLLMLVPLLVVALIFTQPTAKTYAYKFCAQMWFRIYNTVALKIWHAPIPISYVIQADLDQKLAQPHAWAQQQIAADFSNYTDVSVANVQRTFQSLPADQLVMLFTIKDGKLTVATHDFEMNGACKRGLEIYTNIFAFIAQKGYVNNVSFLLRLTDFFAEDSGIEELNFAPILTTSKDLNNKIENKLILIPDYMSLEDIPKFTPRILYANKNYPWAKKEHKVLWRGGEADISGFRHSLVAYNQEHPNGLVDAKFVVDAGSYMPPEVQVKAKFLLNIDGHTAAWTRPIWQLLSNSVFVKQESPLTQWYYQALIPDVHFVPVNNDPTMLETTLAKYSDEQLQTIAMAGHEFAMHNLMIDDMVAYMVMTLQKYEQLQNLHCT